ncbi:acyl-CoA dehydrogenase family protein [Rheinheimera sp. 4Y26]|uniref:acyl-CoA dehydrogenase family protein n=1 Tax=Rheinheimera sp. 4Y26 TaxID=2977811 RepID=UPI0021B11254|nr:acyl-CoA dehydrogenase family protein [Rheinheimera sp. 4Y26]MCT6701402.1 acyl-CoA dehydrogenase family protein [Rheinheimera sp. 4Y26]
MSQYQAPLTDMQFNLFDLWQAPKFWQQQAALSEQLDIDTASAILEEAAKITAELIAPQAQLADQQGVKLANGVVTTPEHYKSCYQQLCDGGWTGLAGDVEYGGMGMPKTLASLYEEMMCSADIAFSLYSGLTAGACVALNQHADETTKTLYLPKLYSGEWSGTMCLTEAHAGSDLGIMRTTASPQPDGSYRISGSKIFITAGEHDLTANIIHLVLAKLPDAPAGSRGISLFLVPKFMVDAQGQLGSRNAVSCGSVEHKMGIHASASCVMNFDGAVGYLIGEPNKGLACMFTMMNYERLAMGSQGLGAAERAYQNALSYAKERLQGRTTGKDANKADPILGHADVRRMLLNIKAINEAGRSFSVYVAQQLDQAKFAGDKKAEARANLLTPVTKAFMTDRGLDACVTAQQVFGGHGYIQEWGMEQLVRDVRIAQIYEGTNGIQALDFAVRKVAADGGAALKELLSDIHQALQTAPQAELSAVLAEYQLLLEELLVQGVQDPQLLPSVACDLLDLTGYLLYGYMWQQTLTALDETKHSDDFIAAKRLTARFYFERILPKAHGLIALLRRPVNVISEFSDNLF